MFFLGVLIALIAAWGAGVVMLFRKGWRVLGIIALAGAFVPLVLLVGFAGWFVDPVDR